MSRLLTLARSAIVLLGLRSTDPTALLSVLALALSAVAGGGPLLGVEHVLPFGLWRVLTVFAWIAGPLAFPIIALAIKYTMGWRIAEEDEVEGIDFAEHGETAYDLATSTSRFGSVMFRIRYFSKSIARSVTS